MPGLHECQSNWSGYDENGLLTDDPIDGEGGTELAAPVADTTEVPEAVVVADQSFDPHGIVQFDDADDESQADIVDIRDGLGEPVRRKRGRPRKQ